MREPSRRLRFCFCEPNTGELPTRLRREEIPIGGADVGRRRNAGTAAQHHLPTHELAVVFAERTRQRPKAWVAKIGARRPLPTIPPPLALRAALVLDEGSWHGNQITRVQQVAFGRFVFGCSLPLELGRQPLPGPMRVGVGFEVADM